jgi:hypothetical protein
MISGNYGKVATAYNELRCILGSESSITSPKYSMGEVVVALDCKLGAMHREDRFG